MATFTLVDYAVLLAILILLSAIGLYYRFTGGKQSSVEEYLLGDRRQSVVPVALSLVASHMSGVSMLGLPAEVYYRGAIYSVTNISVCIVIPTTVYLFLPVFFRVGSSSSFEYLELRFGRRLRTLSAAVYPIQSLLFMAVVLYAPALALETLSGLPSSWSILIVGSVCTFYSTVGGIKAVIMTDVFQLLLSILAVISIIVDAYLDKGSFMKILEIAQEGGRLNFNNFSLDPTERHTWWCLIIGSTITYISTYSVQQSYVQRYLTLKDYRTAVNTLYVSWPVTNFFSLALGFAGLCLYSRYHGCDPLKNGEISRPDQLVPHFALDALGHVPGLPGLVMAGIFSASLSTISGTLNSLSTVTVQDFIKPLFLVLGKPPVTDKGTLVLSKVLVCVYGSLLMVAAFSARHLGGILQGGLSLVGLVGGPMVSVFTLGMFVPWATELGAMVGLVCGVSFSFCLFLGSHNAPITNLPTSTVNCLPLATIITNITNTIQPPLDHRLYLFRISYWWNVVLTTTLTLVVGGAVSWFRGGFSTTAPPHISTRSTKGTSQPCRIVHYTKKEKG